MATTAKIPVQDNNPVAAMQGFLSTLLEKGDIEAVLTPRHMPSAGTIMPSLVTRPEDLAQADPLAPAFPLNAAKLAARLTRGGVEGNVAAVLRPCEIRAFIELVKLNQGAMDNIVLISVDCPGAFTNADYRKFAAGRDGAEASLAFVQSIEKGVPQGANGLDIAKACQACEHPSTDVADISLSIMGADHGQELLAVFNTPRGEGLLTRLGISEGGGGAKARDKILGELREKRIAFRDEMFAATAEATNSLDKLGQYLSGCVNCYNCRAACPVCYCKECVFLTDVFDHKPWQYLGWAKDRGALRMPTDTLFFHATRLAHMSTACIGCGQCSNACPNDVPVMELFRTVGARTQAAFEYEPGRSPDEAPPLAVFQEREFAEITGGLD